MVETLDANEQPGLTFIDFIQACVDGEMWSKTLTYDQWKREKFAETLLPKYNTFVLNDLEAANGDITKLHGGNFYDWMAEVKGLALTPDEEEMRSHKAPFDQAGQEL